MICIAIWAAGLAVFATNVAWCARIALKERTLRRLLVDMAALDGLLSSLCGQAFIMQHAPIWRAWTQTMGTIKVEISQTRDVKAGASE